MQETFFTSSVMMGFFNFIKEIGLLNFIAGGIAVMAFGYGSTSFTPMLQYLNQKIGTELVWSYQG